MKIVKISLENFDFQNTFIERMLMIYLSLQLTKFVEI